MVFVGIAIVAIVVTAFFFLQKKENTAIDLNRIFDIYAPIGLTYNEKDQTLLLDTQMVRYFYDESRELSYFHKKGTVDVVPVYNESTIVSLEKADESTFLQNQTKLEEFSNASDTFPRISYQGQLHFRF